MWRCDGVANQAVASRPSLRYSTQAIYDGGILHVFIRRLFAMGLALRDKAANFVAVPPHALLSQP